LGLIGELALLISTAEASSEGRVCTSTRRREKNSSTAESGCWIERRTRDIVFREEVQDSDTDTKQGGEREIEGEGFNGEGRGGRGLGYRNEQTRRRMFSITMLYR
jgi:hypothetical protein